MGPMSRDERIMAAVMLGAVVLWVCGESLGVASVTAAMLGLGALLVTGVLTWRDCLQYSQVQLAGVWSCVGDLPAQHAEQASNAVVTAAMLGLGALLVTGVLTWRDCHFK